MNRTGPAFAPKRRRTLAIAAALLLCSLCSAGNAWAEKPDHVRKPPRGDICAETPPFVSMEMLAIPIIQDGYVSGILNVKPCFATTADQVDRVTNVLPVLQDLYVRRLHRYASLHVDPRRSLDLHALHSLMQQGADEVLRAAVPGASVPVLFTFVAMRRLG